MRQRIEVTPTPANGEEEQIRHHQIEQLLDAVMLRRPTLAEVIGQFGQTSLNEYSNGFVEQPPDSEGYLQFVKTAADLTREILGPETAKKLRQRLEKNAAILTANHHGPEWLPITLHGDLVFGFPDILNQRNGVLPIFAFGDIPLNNLTWPIGIIVGETRFKIHPNSRQQTLVTHTPPLTEEQIEKAIGRIAQSNLPEPLKTAGVNILSTIFLSESVLKQPDFPSQSTVINHMLWPQFFNEELHPGLPEMVYLQMETIVSRLLREHDLNNPQSLIHQILFNPTLRDNVLATLNDQYGCWNDSQISELHTAYKDKDSKRAQQLEKGSGTMFFWGVDYKGKRFPLILETQEEGSAVLKGVTKRGEEVSMPFTPEAITQALEKGITPTSKEDSRKWWIIPSLFTSFTVIAFARGIKCYGGFMQVDYLTAMRDNLAKALLEKGFNDEAEKVNAVSTKNYSTGMTLVIIQETDGKIRPANTVDIIAAGGLTREDLQRVSQTTIGELNLLGLPAMYPVIYPPQERDENLAALTLNDVFREIEEKLICLRP